MKMNSDDIDQGGFVSLISLKGNVGNGIVCTTACQV